jgi:hypothetical protein
MALLPSGPRKNQKISKVPTGTPEIVYIGTGQYGDLPITPEAKTVLSQFETVIRPTPEILEILEKEKLSFAAIIHVTC